MTYKAFFWAVAISIGIATPAAAADPIRIGTGGITGAYFLMGNAICEVVAIAGIERECVAEETAGSTYNLAQIAEGAMPLAMVQADWQFQSYQGTSDKVAHNEGLRALLATHAEPFHLIAANYAGIVALSDLKGKRVNIGNPGSGHRATAELLFERHGLALSSFGEVKELSSNDHAHALCAGDIDAFVYTVGAPNEGVAVATDACGAQVVPVASDKVKEMVEEFRYYGLMQLPAGSYRTVEETLTTFGTYATLVTDADVDEQLVYEVVKAIFENEETFRELGAPFATLPVEDMMRHGLSAPLHPGAIRYYREAGLL